MIEPFFPKDRDKARVFEIYRDSRIDYFYRWFQMGHVMDFRLRQGETFTRWWRPQGGRWHHLDAYNTDDTLVEKVVEMQDFCDRDGAALCEVAGRQDLGRLLDHDRDAAELRGYAEPNGLVANAVQVPIRPDEQLTVADRWRCVEDARIAKMVAGQQFKVGARG